MDDLSARPAPSDPVPSQVTAVAPIASTPAVTASAVASQAIQRALSFNQSSFIPPFIWTEPWNPDHPSPATYTINNLAEHVFDAAVQGENDHGLTVQGTNVAGLVSNFRAKIAAAVIAGDFTNILSPDRSFLV